MRSRQRFPHTCANAAIRMVAADAGVRVGERAVGRLARPEGPGFGLLTDREIRRALRALGLAPRAIDPSELGDHLAGRAVVVTLSAHATPWMAPWHRRLLRRHPRLGHALVLAREGSRVVCRDPSWLHGGRRVLRDGELAALAAAPRVAAVSVSTQVVCGDRAADREHQRAEGAA